MRRKYIIPVIYLTLLLVHDVLLQSNNADEQGQVTDNQKSGRDDDSTAITAIIVTSVVCGIAAILCIGMCAFCCYQKCCVEGLSI